MRRHGQISRYSCHVSGRPTILYRRRRGIVADDFGEPQRCFDRDAEPQSGADAAAREMHIADKVLRQRARSAQLVTIILAKMSGFSPLNELPALRQCTPWGKVLTYLAFRRRRCWAFAGARRPNARARSNTGVIRHSPYRRARPTRLDDFHLRYANGRRAGRGIAQARLL